MAAVAVAGAAFLVIVGMIVVLARYMRISARGSAIVISRSGGPRVVFDQAMVLPLVHRAETIDLSVHAIPLELRGREGLVCRDCIRADVRVVYLVRVNRTAEDVVKVADSIGCARASDPGVIAELFGAKVTEALKLVARKLEFTELLDRRDEFRDQTIEVIGRDLNGYVLDDLVIESVTQTPIAELDPQNILDAEGIRRITEIAARHAVVVHELQQEERMKIAKQKLYADEAVLRFEQERAEAEARAHLRGVSPPR